MPLGTDPQHDGGPPLGVEFLRDDARDAKLVRIDVRRGDGVGSAGSINARSSPKLIELEPTVSDVITATARTISPTTTTPTVFPVVPWCVLWDFVCLTDDTT